MSSFLQDLRHAIYRIVRAPGLVAVAVLSLGLGIGATSTVFSLVDAIVLRPWPIREASSLARLYARSADTRDRDFSYPEYLDLREQATALPALAAYDRRGALLRTNDGTELLFVNVVSENYFAVLGVEAERGRTGTFDQSGREVVISHDLWQRAFGGDPAIVGKSIRLSTTDVTVIGVASRHFRGLDAYLSCAVWIPRATWTSMGNGRDFLDREARSYQVVGRLAPGATLSRAGTELELVGSRLAAAYPATNRNTSYEVVNEARDRIGRLEILLALAFSTVGLVLIICCGNVAGLLIVQAEARRREIAVRLSLGASRGRVFRLLLGESLLLALIGAALGLLLTAWFTRLVPALMPPGPFSLDARVEIRVVMLTLALSLLATLLAGVLPARGASRTDVHPVLKGGGPRLRYGHRMISLRDVLVVGQVTLSFVLLAIAAVFLRSFVNTLRINPGFDVSKRLLLVQVAPGFLQHADRRDTLHQELAARFARLPGVARSSYARRFHLSGSGGGATVKVSVPGVIAPAGGDTWDVKFNAIGPDYLRTVGTAIVRGREFTSADSRTAQPVMLISEAMARQFMAAADPVGRSLRVNGVDRQIVGLVRDSSINNLREDIEPYLYLPYAQSPSGETTLIIETSRDPRLAMSGVRQAIRDVAPDLPVLGVLTLEDQMAVARYDQTMPAALSGGLGVLGMFLAAVGLYGAVAYAVTRRTRDIGVRVALGAHRRDIMGMVLRQGMGLAGAGIVIGAGVATLSARLLATGVVGVGGIGLLFLAGPGVVVTGVTLLACYLPARRAARMDPISALRAE